MNIRIANIDDAEHIRDIYMPYVLNMCSNTKSSDIGKINL